MLSRRLVRFLLVCQVLFSLFVKVFIILVIKKYPMPLYFSMGYSFYTNLIALVPLDNASFLLVSLRRIHFPQEE
jgi:hypothetical protein